MPIHTLAKNLSPNNQAPCRENSSPKEFHRTVFRLILSAFRQFGDFETKRRLFVLSSRSEHIIHVTGITNLLTTYFLPSLDKVDIYIQPIHIHNSTLCIFRTVTRLSHYISRPILYSVLLMTERFASTVLPIGTTICRCRNLRICC